MQGKIDCYGMTDVGCQRPSNQDQFLIADLNKALRLYQCSLSIDDYETVFGSSQGQLFLVADGMGGHAAGERASQIAVETVTTYMLNTMPWFFRLDKDRDDDFREELTEALMRCQQQISVHTDALPEHEGMGTALTMAYLIWPRMYVVHVGDCRCYVHRQGDLRRITKDHTIAQQFADSGAFDPEEVEDRWHNTLWNVIGGESDELSPEVDKVELRLGDTVLLCSDGLTKHVPSDAIGRLFGDNRTSAEMCAQLVDAARRDGGSDNITVVVVRILDTEQSVQQAGRVAVAHTDAETGPFADTAIELSARREIEERPQPAKISTQQVAKA